MPAWTLATFALPPSHSLISALVEFNPSHAVSIKAKSRIPFRSDALTVPRSCPAPVLLHAPGFRPRRYKTWLHAKEKEKASNTLDAPLPRLLEQESRFIAGGYDSS